MPVPPTRPILFLVATAAVTLALVVHTFALYGRSRARALLLTIAFLALVKELGGKEAEYQVLLTGMRPLGIPVGVVGGWLIATLLGLDFGRRVGFALLPARAGHLALRLCLAGGFAWFLSIAIEPVAQVAGWWKWRPEVTAEFPHLEAGGWMAHVQVFAAAGLVVAGMKGRRLRGALGAGVCLIAIPVVWSLLLPSLGPLLCLLQLVGLLIPRLDVDPEMIPRIDGEGRARWVEWIPFLSTWVVLGTLAYYGLASAESDVLRYSAGAAVLCVLAWVLPGRKGDPDGKEGREGTRESGSLPRDRELEPPARSGSQEQTGDVQGKGI